MATPVRTALCAYYRPFDSQEWSVLACGAESMLALTEECTKAMQALPVEYRRKGYLLIGFTDEQHVRDKDMEYARLWDWEVVSRSNNNRKKQRGFGDLLELVAGRYFLHMQQEQVARQGVAA